MSPSQDSGEPLTPQIKIEQGAKVTAHFNSNSKSLEPLLGNYNSQSKIQAVKADLRVEDDVIKLFSSAQLAFGSVQIIIVNHAISVVKDDYLWEMSLDRWRTTIDTNLTSSFLVTREYLKQLKTASLDVKEKAAIVFIGSTAGKYGNASSSSWPTETNSLAFIRRSWTRRLCSFQKWYV
jgi:NAD(P)-dependent dehydrogenase (short-subunit alcohol dehydrogenase family)